MKTDITFMKTDIREYGERLDVEVKFDQEEKRWVIIAFNQGGYDCTMIDLMDVVDWYSENSQVLKDNDFGWLRNLESQNIVNRIVKESVKVD